MSGFWSGRGYGTPHRWTLRDILAFVGEWGCLLLLAVGAMLVTWVVIGFLAGASG